MEKLKKNYIFWGFLAVFLIAVFLRVWNFESWLFFKMDQARDAFLIKQAFENGIGWLPFLGPKAGGTHLNLGPAFYYFQYLSAILFQSVRPAVLAYPDLFFSILSVPLFFLYLRKYFSRNWSSAIAGLYAICFLGIQYSRFAWNPNSLVFFNLLYFFALLNIFDDRVKYRLRWVVAAALSFAVSTQLHFLSFATLPVITLIFLLANRKDVGKYLGWKYAAIFIGIVFFVYLPVILNEYISHGKNTAEFFSALKEKPSHHSFWKNILRDFRYWGQNWFLILTGWISRKTSLKPAILAWLGVMLPGLFLAAENFFREKNDLKKKFLLISILWFLVYFLVYIPVAYQIRPRFFLPMLVLPFIFVGYISEYFWGKGQLLKMAVVSGLIFVFSSNLAGTSLWFKEIEAAQKRGVYPKRTIILKARDGIVAGHLEKAVQYVRKSCSSKTVFYSSNTEYKYPIRYLLALENMRGASFANFNRGEEGCFFAFGLTRSKNGIDSSIEKDFTVLEKEKIGALSVYRLVPNEVFLNRVKTTKEKAEDERLFWKDL